MALRMGHINIAITTVAASSGSFMTTALDGHQRKGPVMRSQLATFRITIAVALGGYPAATCWRITNRRRPKNRQLAASLSHLHAYPFTPPVNSSLMMIISSTPLIFRMTLSPRSSRKSWIRPRAASDRVCCVERDQLPAADRRAGRFVFVVGRCELPTHSVKAASIRPDRSRVL